MAICGTPAADRLEVLRSRFKAAVAGLEEEQTFCVIIADATSSRREPSEGFARATAEQKVRAHDLIDRIRASALSPDPAAMTQTLVATGADAVWLFVTELPTEKPWTDFVADPILPIHIVTLEPARPPDWLEPHLSTHRVTLESLADAAGTDRGAADEDE